MWNNYFPWCGSTFTKKNMHNTHNHSYFHHYKTNLFYINIPWDLWDLSRVCFIQVYSTWIHFSCFQATLSQCLHRPPRVDWAPGIHGPPLQFRGSCRSAQTNAALQTSDTDYWLSVLDLEARESTCCLQNTPPAQKRWNILHFGCFSGSKSQISLFSVASEGGCSSVDVFFCLFCVCFSIGGAVRAVIVLLHADMHQRGTVGSVCHLATALITVAPGVKRDKAMANITKRSKSGKVVQDVRNLLLFSPGVTCLCSYFVEIFLWHLSLFLIFIFRRRYSAFMRISLSPFTANALFLNRVWMTLRKSRCSLTPSLKPCL